MKLIKCTVMMAFEDVYEKNSRDIVTSLEETALDRENVEVVDVTQVAVRQVDYPDPNMEDADADRQITDWQTRAMEEFKTL